MADTTAPALNSLDSVRAKIFDDERNKCRKIPIKFNGADLEFREPNLDELSRIQEDAERNFVAVAAINFMYIAGTDIKVFEEADYDRILKFPIGGEWSRVAKVIVETLNVNVEDKAKN